jgi:hypothetical protein
VADRSFAHEPSSPGKAWTCRERFLQFVLDRVVHDFSSAIGGIICLMEHHLEHDRLEPGLQTSLNLIRDSVEQCRGLLSGVSSALHPSVDDHSYVRAGDLVDGVGRLLQLLLPGSIRLVPTGPSSQAIVRVSPPDFKMRWLAIAGVECESLPGASQVGFGATTKDGLCWFYYRSSNPHWAGSISEAQQILLPLAGSLEHLRCQAGSQGFLVEVGLPLVCGA